MAKVNKDLNFTPDFYDTVSKAWEMQEADDLGQVVQNKEYVLGLLFCGVDDDDLENTPNEYSGVNMLLAVLREAIAMKEARGGKQLSGKDLIELGLSSDDPEEKKRLRKIRDGLNRLNNPEDFSKFVTWCNNHKDFKFVSIWDAIRACFRKVAETSEKLKPTDLLAVVQKILDGLENAKFDPRKNADGDEIADSTSYSVEEISKIGMLLGLRFIPTEQLNQAGKKAQEKLLKVS